MATIVGLTACGAEDAGVTTRRADSGTVDTADTGATSDRTDSTQSAGDTESTGAAIAPLDPATLAADLPNVLDLLGFPSPFPLPDGFDPTDLVGMRVDQSVAFGEPEVEYELAFTQPDPSDREAFFAEWLDRIDESFGTGGEFGRGTSNSDTIETEFVSAGFASDESGSWDVEIVQPVGASGGEVTLVITASYEVDSFAPIELPADITPELPDLSSCTTVSGDLNYRVYTDLMNGPDEHEYRISVDLRCTGAAMLDATTAWVEGLDASGADGSVSTGDGYANVFEHRGEADGLIYTFESILADDGSGDTVVHVRIDRAL